MMNFPIAFGAGQDENVATAKMLTVEGSSRRRFESFSSELPELPRTPSVEHSGVQENVSNLSRTCEGKVVAWVQEKGFGFIETDSFEGKVIFKRKNKEDYYQPSHGDLVTFELGPKDDESLSFTEIQIVFRPGKLGMRFEWESGTVRQIIPGTQSAEAGLRMGCVLKYIDGELYSERMLRAKIEARKHFTATFTVPIRPSFTGSATNFQAIRVKAVDAKFSIDDTIRACSITSDDLYGIGG